MKRYWLGLAAATMLSACGSGGGNPFIEDTDTDDPEVGVPADVAQDLQGISYDPVSQTLTVRGITLDNEEFEAVYNRRPALDRNGYEAYTSQDSSLSRHTTAYVRDIDGTRAAVVTTGGQFEYFFGGAVYGRAGAYDPPSVTGSGGLASYAGRYIGMLNGPGDGGDLLPVTPGTSPSVTPVQAGEVTGKVLVNADFTDNAVNGIIYDRTYVDSPGTEMVDLELAPTAIDPASGTFVGDVSIQQQVRGSYGGIFGGDDAATVAGGIYVEDHITSVQNEVEYGIFVLPKCGTPGDAALCDQPNP